MSAGCCRAARQDPSLARSYRGVVTAAESQHRPGVQRSATNLSRLPPLGVRLRIRAPMWQRCKLAASTSPAEKARFIGSHEPWLPTPLQRSRSRVVTRAAAADWADPCPSDESEVRARRVSLYAALGIVLLHLLGFTMLGPILPSLAAHYSLPNHQIGYLTSAYPLGMVAALAVWPRLSDHIGRRPVLAVSLAGVGLGFIAQGVAVAKNWPFWVFISLRVLSGAMAGASPVLKAYIVDIASEEEMPRFMAWREAAATLAYIIGPVLGGLLFEAPSATSSSASLALVIAAAGAGSVGAAGLVGVMLNEQPYMARASKQASEARPSTPPRPSTPSTSHTAPQDGSEGLSCPLGEGYISIVAVICLTSFLYNVGQANFDAFFAVLAVNKFQLSPKQVGLMLTSLAVMSFVVSSAVFSKVQRRFGLVPTCITGLTLVSAGLACMGLVPTVPLLWMVALVYVVGIPLFTPTVPILLMKCVPPNKRGQVMGLDSAVNTVGRIFGPVLFGIFYGKFGAEVSFLLAGGVVFLAAVVTVVRKLYTVGKYGS